MELFAIYASGSNGAFGLNNELAWHEPNDLNYFKQLTKGHAVIMGRNSWLSLPDNYRPLPGRDNLIVSNTMKGDNVYPSIEAAVKAARQLNNAKAFVIGGAALIESALPMVDLVYRTRVPYHGPFDVAAPVLDGTAWRLIKKDECANYNCTANLVFEIYRPVGLPKAIRSVKRKLQYKVRKLLI